MGKPSSLRAAGAAATTIAVRTNGLREARDVTDVVAAEIKRLALDEVALIMLPHTTAAITLTEDDPDFLRDMERVAQDLLAPFEPFAHHKNDNPNAAAHLISLIVGVQLLIPCLGGQMDLGQYQRLILLELDGPKTREIRIYHAGEATL